MGVLTSIFLGAIGSLVAAELWSWGPSLSRVLTRFAARLLSAEKRERYLEEWLAELEHVPCGTWRLLWAVGLVLTACSERVSDILRAIGKRKEKVDAARHRIIMEIACICISITTSTSATELIYKRVLFVDLVHRAPAMSRLAELLSVGFSIAAGLLLVILRLRQYRSAVLAIRSGDPVMPSSKSGAPAGDDAPPPK